MALRPSRPLWGRQTLTRAASRQGHRCRTQTCHDHQNCRRRCRTVQIRQMGAMFPGHQPDPHNNLRGSFRMSTSLRHRVRPWVLDLFLRASWHTHQPRLRSRCWSHGLWCGWRDCSMDDHQHAWPQEALHLGNDRYDHSPGAHGHS